MGKKRSLKFALPQRIPILYLIVGVLVALSVVPMYFYARQVLEINRERLKTNEMLLQNTITRSLSDEISQKMGNLDSMLGNLGSAIQVTSGGDLAGNKVSAPELRALLERFVSSSNDIAYVTLLNTEAKGQSVGRINPVEFLHANWRSVCRSQRWTRLQRPGAADRQWRQASHDCARECADHGGRTVRRDDWFGSRPGVSSE